MATRRIRFSLDTASINRAIQEVEQYKKDLIDAVNNLVRTLTEEGREAAVLNVLQLGAFDTGELADSFQGYYDSSTGVGIIRTDVYYAVFVEYGTGVVGAGSPYTGPFMPGSVTVKGKTYTAYDTNNHGDAGWHYISDRDGKWHWTKGQESRPFFYRTYMQLVQMAQQRLANLQI